MLWFLKSVCIFIGKFYFNFYIDSYYYLPNVSKLVNAVIQECEYYSQHTPSTAVPPLQPLISKQPMHIVEVDFFGPVDPDPVTAAK